MSETNMINDLAHYRKRMRLTQAEVAKLIGQDHRYISHLELGSSSPTLMTALALAAIYRVPTEFLFSRRYHTLREEVRCKETELRGGTFSPELTLQGHAAR